MTENRQQSFWVAGKFHRWSKVGWCYRGVAFWKPYDVTFVQKGIFNISFGKMRYATKRFLGPNKAFKAKSLLDHHVTHADFSEFFNDPICSSAEIHSAVLVVLYKNGDMACAVSPQTGQSLYSKLHHFSSYVQKTVPNNESSLM
jgi:hypothetical protein